MKVYISSDFEGASGIVHYDQTDLAHPEFVRGRKLLMGEVNAAIEGALAQGASEILVNDAHWTYRNLVLEDLNPAAVLLSGKPKPYMMMAGIDGGYEAAFFIAYHARAGSAFANLDHSSNDLEIVQSVWLNDREVGETGLNAALAGYFGVPVVLVTGDQTTCAEAKDLGVTKIS
jgi:D-amino peptidase